MSNKPCSEEYRTIHVCVDGFQSGVLRGRLFNHSLTAGRSFHCLSQFLQEVEQTLDSMKFPKAYTAPRTFRPKQISEAAPPKEDHHSGLLATFSLRILFRQNASWQGSVTWLDNNQEQSFRSVLELILLFDNALTQTQAS